MNNLTSIILPTSTRYQQAAKVIARFRATTVGYPVEIITIVDSDAAVTALTGLAKVVRLPENTGPWRPRAVEAWNLGAAQAVGAVLVLAADDLWPFHGWLGETLERLGDFTHGDGLVGFNDLGRSGMTFATHFAVTRQFAKQYLGGVLCCPAYQHYYVDQEACARARAAHCYVWARNAVVEHVHPAFGKAETDTLYLRTAPYLSADQTTWERRQAAGFPNDFVGVLA